MRAQNYFGVRCVRLLVTAPVGCAMTTTYSAIHLINSFIKCGGLMVLRSILRQYRKNRGDVRRRSKGWMRSLLSVPLKGKRSMVDRTQAVVMINNVTDNWDRPSR